ncbi:MAG: hypothetical protein AB7V48_17410 [Sedimentibacter sp.]
MLSRIYGLLNYCYKDNSGDKLPDIELQLFLIAVKCLMPSENEVGCYFDVERYKKEIELFKCYKNGLDETLEYYIENKKPSEKYDNLLEYKIIPIITANTQWDILLNEALRTSMFYSLNKNTILNTILISSAINGYLNANLENINEITKERLINFSLKDFLKSNNIIMNKNSLIEFEKERIKLLTQSKLINDELISEFKSLHYVYNEIKNENMEATNETVLCSFSSYLFKLRKGIINPEKLKISTDNVPEIKEFLKYTTFSHPLLGRCKVIKRGEKEVILKNKSGLIKVNI